MEKTPFRFGGDDARNYEQYLGPLIFERSALEMMDMVKALSPQHILETSCGSGRLTRHLHEGFPTAHFTATDLSDDMLQMAIDKMPGTPVQFAVADGQQLPFNDGMFDLVINQYGLMFFPDRQQGFNEAYRVLQTGGRFVFATWDRSTEMPFFKTVIDDHLLPLLEGEDTTRFRLAFSMHDPRQLLQHLQQAGFTQNRVTLTQFTGRANSIDDLLIAFFDKHPMGREVASRAPEKYDEIRASIQAAYRRQFGDGKVVMPLQAWIGMGVKA